MSGVRGFPGSDYDRWKTTEPPEEPEPELEDGPGYCLSCGAECCDRCGRCGEPYPVVVGCLNLQCACTVAQLRGADMPQDAYERAVDDAVDDARMQDDERPGYDADKLADYQRDDLLVPGGGR